MDFLVCYTRQQSTCVVKWLVMSFAQLDFTFIDFSYT